MTIAHILSTALVFPAIVAIAGAQPDEKPTIKWRTDYNMARKEHEAKKLPIVILFTRPNAAPAERTRREFEANKALADYLNSKTVPVVVDAFENPDFAKRLGISASPTIVLAGADGRIRDMLVGYQEPEGFLKRLTIVFDKNEAPAKK